MLNIQSNEQNVRIEHSENPVDLGIEIGIVVSQIYNALRSDDETAAELFKGTVITCLTPDSPAWERVKKQVVIKIPMKKGGAPHRPKLGHRAICKSSRMGLCDYIIAHGPIFGKYENWR